MTHPHSTPDDRASYLSAKLDAVAAHLADHNADGARQVLADMQAAGYDAELRVLIDALVVLPIPPGPAVERSTAHVQAADLQRRGSLGWGRTGSGKSTPQMIESSLLTAARRVERWRGLPSATRISRELGIGMPLATSLAETLRDEDEDARRQGHGHDH